MEKTITVDGRAVRLRASAMIPRLYRIKFRRDIMQDMKAIKASYEKAMEDKQSGDGYLDMDAITMFENVAYLMAKHADKDNVPDTPEDWLDGFETFSIYEIFPAIQELWLANLKTIAVPAKK